MNIPMQVVYVPIEELPNTTMTQDEFLKELKDDPKAYIRFPDSVAGFDMKEPQGLKILGLPLFKSVTFIRSADVEIAQRKKVNLYGVINVTWEQISKYLQEALNPTPNSQPS